jgi:hypothetical protein
MISPPSGGLIFHVIVDDFNRTFSIDGPEGPSGVRLHYEMQQVIRQQNKKLRDFRESAFLFPRVRLQRILLSGRTQGGQAVVAGDKVTSRTRGRRRSGGGGMVKDER